MALKSAFNAVLGLDQSDVSECIVRIQGQRFDPAGVSAGLQQLLHVPGAELQCHFSVYLQDTTPDELLSAVMSAVLTDVGLSPDQLGDVCVGEARFFPLTLT